MTDRFKDLPRVEGPQGLIVPKMELLPLEDPIFGLTSVQYIFEDVYGAIDTLYRENTDPDSPDPLVVSSEGKSQVVLSQRSDVYGPSYRGHTRVTHQYSLDSTQGELAFNLLGLKVETSSTRSKNGYDLRHTPHNYAKADSDPWGLTHGFDINANHMTFFGPEYPSKLQIKRFHDRSVAVLRLLGIVSPERDDELDDICDMPISY